MHWNKILVTFQIRFKTRLHIKTQFRNSFGKMVRNSAETGAFPQNLHSRKLVEIMVFYALDAWEDSK